MSEITHGGLFSGIGGFSKGFADAGIKTIWDVEIEPYSQAVLRKNYPETEIFSDVREVGKHNLSPVDIISGGFPCTGFSCAGKQRKFKDPGSILWFEMFRIISELRPKFAIVENVSDIAKSGLGRILAGFASIGYDAEWQNISAASIGAPHIRNRLWIVAYPQHTNPNGIGSHREKINKPGKIKFQNKQKRKPGSLVQKQIWTEFDTGIFGMAYGIPHRVDRIKGLGKTIAPRIAEIIGRRLAEIINQGESNAT